MEPDAIEIETPVDRSPQTRAVTIAPPRDGLTSFGNLRGLEAARAYATELDGLIREKGLAVIGGKHLRIEAWCALGTMVGLSPRTAWTRQESNPQSGELEGYTARVEVLRVATGEVVGAAEASCHFDEIEYSRKRRGWFHRWVQSCQLHESARAAPCGLPDRHAAQSMAQTRAASKALAALLRFVPVLAGYSGTPAEEMPPDAEEAPGNGAPPRSSRGSGRRAAKPPARGRAPAPEPEDGARPATKPQLEALRKLCLARAAELLELAPDAELDEQQRREWHQLAGSCGNRAREFLGLGNSKEILREHVDPLREAIKRCGVEWADDGPHAHLEELECLF